MGLDTTREVAPQAYHILSYDLNDENIIGQLADGDPLLLHFAIGFLLRFEP